MQGETVDKTLYVAMGHTQSASVWVSPYPRQLRQENNNWHLTRLPIVTVEPCNAFLRIPSVGTSDDPDNNTEFFELHTSSPALWAGRAENTDEREHELHGLEHCSECNSYQTIKKTVEKTKVKTLACGHTKEPTFILIVGWKTGEKGRNAEKRRVEIPVDPATETQAYQTLGGEYVSVGNQLMLKADGSLRDKDGKPTIRNFRVVTEQLQPTEYEYSGDFERNQAMTAKLLQRHRDRMAQKPLAVAPPSIFNGTYKQGRAYRELARPAVSYDPLPSHWPDLHAHLIKELGVKAYQGRSPFFNDPKVRKAWASDMVFTVPNSTHCADSKTFGKTFFEMPLDHGEESEYFLPRTKFRDGELVKGSRLVGRFNDGQDSTATPVFDKSNSTFYLQKVKQAKKPTGEWSEWWLKEYGVMLPDTGRKRADAKLPLFSLPLLEKEGAAALLELWNKECKAATTHLRGNKQLMDRFLRLAFQFCKDQAQQCIAYVKPECKEPSMLKVGGSEVLQEFLSKSAELKVDEKYMQWITRAYALGMIGAEGSVSGLGWPAQRCWESGSAPRTISERARWAKDQEEKVQGNEGYTISQNLWKRFGESKHTQHIYEGNGEWKEVSCGGNLNQEAAQCS